MASLIDLDDNGMNAPKVNGDRQEDILKEKVEAQMRELGKFFNYMGWVWNAKNF